MTLSSTGVPIAFLVLSVILIAYTFFKIAELYYQSHIQQTPYDNPGGLVRLSHFLARDDTVNALEILVSLSHPINSRYYQPSFLGRWYLDIEKPPIDSIKELLIPRLNVIPLSFDRLRFLFGDSDAITMMLLHKKGLT